MAGSAATNDTADGLRNYTTPGGAYPAAALCTRSPQRHPTARAAARVLSHEIGLAMLLAHQVRVRHERYRWAGAVSAARTVAVWLLFPDQVGDHKVSFVTATVPLVGLALVTTTDSYLGARPPARLGPVHRA